MEHPQRAVRSTPKGAARRSRPAGSAAADAEGAASGGLAPVVSRRSVLTLLAAAGPALAQQAPPKPAPTAPGKPVPGKPAPAAPPKPDAPKPVEKAEFEYFRLRVVNQDGGDVQLSSDRGQTWEALGKVTRAATTVANASPVVGIAPAGTVAGVAPDSLLLRVPGPKDQTRTLRISAQGAVPAADSTIATDLAARAPLFRLVAPPTGSKVLLDRGGKVSSLPANYLPQPGDALVILVAEPGAAEPLEITLENKEGGEVVLAAPGGVPRVVGRVKQPVKGVGRYAGTDRAGSGRILTWTPTAVVVSTAGVMRRVDAAGLPIEERGGFVIQPAEPALKGATHPASLLLVEALPEGNVKPPVARLFGLPVPVSSGDPLDLRQTRVDVRLDGGEWEPMPDLRGPVDEAGMAAALKASVGKDRTVGAITHLRIVYGGPTPNTLARRLHLAATPLVDPPQRGRVTISANIMGEGITFVVFFLDGVQTQLTNLPPFSWSWDTTTVANGEHLIEIRGLDSKLAVVTTATTRVMVDN